MHDELEMKAIVKRDFDHRSIRKSFGKNLRDGFSCMYNSILVMMVLLVSGGHFSDLPQRRLQ